MKIRLALIAILFIVILYMNGTSAKAAPLGLSNIGAQILDRNASNVYFIYPDYDTDHPKPAGVGYATLSDWTAMGVVYAMCSKMPQNQTPDTRSTIINSAGMPQVSNLAIVVCGGPIVHAVVKYYEDNRIAPVYFGLNGSTLYWYSKSGSRINATAMQSSDMQSGHKDMFVIELFTDASGNTVFIIYGYGWKGTFAGARFFKFIVYPNISSYTSSWYIFQWTDANGDGFPDLSEINATPVASGN